MENAIWLASIFGPFLTILGLWMLLYSENLMKIFTSMKSTPGAFYLGGILNLLLGLTVLAEYNMWHWSSLTVLVTLLGWVLLLRGICVLFVPQLVIRMTMTHPTVVKTLGLVPFIWGLLLSWLAFHF